ncbi:Ig-like domain-containing protein, partial [bacterium]|nr:Ig-like domain-containing protein [bacterium]
MKKVILISFLCSLILGFIQACSESDEDSPLITLNTALTVVSISPPDGTVGVDVTTDVSVTFSKSMNTSSITTNTADTSCSGSFQLSSDGFSTCEKMSASPTASAEDKTFLVSPASGLANSATYVVRITTSAKDSAGGTLADQYTAATGFTTVAASPTKIYLFQGSDSTVAGDLG